MRAWGVYFHGTPYNFPKKSQKSNCQHVFSKSNSTHKNFFKKFPKSNPLDKPRKDRYNTRMDTNLSTYNSPENPAEIGAYPPTLPVEIALRVAPLKDICAAYGISRDEWLALKNDPVFQRDLTAAVELVKKDGMSFRLKAKLQSEELLKTSWRMIHAKSDEVPASVRADLLKFTIRAAGLAEPAEKAGGLQNALQININLS